MAHPRPGVRFVGMVAALLLLGTSAVAAQPPAAPPDRPDTLAPSAVALGPQLDSASTVRVQRLLLRNGGTWTGFEGSLRLAFTIDTMGRVVRSTVRVLDADTGAFARRYAPIVASELRYSPAVRGGAPARVEYEQRIEYRHPGDRGGDLSVAPLLPRVRETETPHGSTIRLEWVPVAAAPLASFSADSSRARQLDAIAAAIVRPTLDSLATACVKLRDGGRDVHPRPGEVARLRAVRPRVATPGECPETYASGWAVFNEDGTQRVRPAGAGPDPYVAEVTGVVAWTDEWVVVGLRILRSGATEVLRCELHRPAEDPWKAECRTTERSIF